MLKSKKNLKRLISFALVISMLMCSMIILSVSAEEEACSHTGGTALRLLEHNKSGGNCSGTAQTYCPQCGIIWDTYKFNMNPCPGNGAHS